ncbi:MAG: hypothetical protein UV23_C0017G0014 [Candidatus Nomurabacteria bacterium GW2011_GWF1_42_40]|nr:MAG: hypothetical protein UV23_C0017G0014 [Candidatus Nomurabacteria bacterium GW2011_GWF1_42_40]
MSYLTVKGTFVPEFPVATMVLAGFLVTLEVSTGFIVFQEKLIMQLLLLNAMSQEGEAGVSVPDMPSGMALQMLPSQILPAEQEAVTESWARMIGVPSIL